MCVCVCARVCVDKDSSVPTWLSQHKSTEMKLKVAYYVRLALNRYDFLSPQGVSLFISTDSGTENVMCCEAHEVVKPTSDLTAV